MAKIELKNVSKSFGPKKVLQGLSFDVADGESLVIIGGSGTGKSVMLKCILGLLQADSGSIKIDGQELVGGSKDTLDAARHKIGMLFQGSALFDSLSVAENICFSLLQEGQLKRQQAIEVAQGYLRSVGLKPEVASLYPAELSGGMQRRVGLARAIACKPQILFCDEPTAGLDPIISGVINDLIRRNVTELGATAITITHDLNSARKIGDKIAMIYEGQIIWCGKASDIDHCDHPHVQQFIHGRTEGPIHVEVG